MMGLEVRKTYTDGFGRKHAIVSISNVNPAEWVIADGGAVFRACDGRKCVWDSIERKWRCPEKASRWDLKVDSGR